MQSASRMRRTGEPTPAKAKRPVARGPQKPVASGVAEELRQITAILEDYKALDLVVIPLAGQASFADYLVVATGTSTRHVASMGQGLQEKMGRKAFLGMEGLADGEWVCADTGNIVVHLFLAEKRALYNLEKLWSYVFKEPADPNALTVEAAQD